MKCVVDKYTKLYNFNVVSQMSLYTTGNSVGPC